MNREGCRQSRQIECNEHKERNNIAVWELFLVFNISEIHMFIE